MTLYTDIHDEVGQALDKALSDLQASIDEIEQELRESMRKHNALGAGMIAYALVLLILTR